MARHVAFIALVAAVLMFPSLLAGAPSIDSAIYNYVWTKQFAAELARGELYPRWLPDSFSGLGSPVFYFYPPLAYYVSGVLHLVGLPVRHAISCAAFLFLFASGLTMYVWLRVRSERALLGACLYMMLPYHLGDFYVRGALSEFSSYVWIPLIALAVDAQPRRWALPLLAFSYSGLILSHAPITVLVTAFLIVPWVLYRAWVERDPQLLLANLAGGSLGIGLAAIYLIPALALMEHISARIMWAPSFLPANWFILHPGPGVPIAVVNAMASLAIAAFVAAFAAKRSFWAWLAAGLAVLSLGTPALLWDLPLIRQVQFPWRMLVIVDFALVTALLSGRAHRLVLAAAFGLVVPTCVNFASASWDALRTSLPPSVDRSLPDASEYLPAGFHPPSAGAYDPDGEMDWPREQLVRGPVTNIVREPGGGVRFEANASGAANVRVASFPGWRVTRDGVEVPAAPGRTIAVEVRPGRYRVARTPLPIERISVVVWLLSVLSICALPFAVRSRRGWNEARLHESRARAGS